MKIIQQNENRLRIKAGDTVLAWWLLGFGVLCLGIAAFQLVRNPAVIRVESFQGLAASGALFLFGFLVSYENAEFNFAGAERRLHWRRRRIFSTKEGAIPFDDIR